MIEQSTRSTAAWASHALEVYLLGLVDFDQALTLQERLIYEISGRDDRQGALLLCEHPRLITIGREGSREQVLVEPSDPLLRHVEIRWLNRGGGSLAHGPGQLAVYPIVPLDRLNLGICEYRQRLQQAVVETCGELRVEAHQDDGKSGVWGRYGQFAFIGAGVRSWVAHHGLFINVCPELELMRLARWSGEGERITSLAAQRLRPTSMHAVRESIIRTLAAQLGYERYHTYSGHPLLQKAGKHSHVYA